MSSKKGIAQKHRTEMKNGDKGDDHLRGHPRPLDFGFWELEHKKAQTIFEASRTLGPVSSEIRRTECSDRRLAWADYRHLASNSRHTGMKVNVEDMGE